MKITYHQRISHACKEVSYIDDGCVFVSKRRSKNANVCLICVAQLLSSVLNLRLFVDVHMHVKVCLFRDDRSDALNITVTI